MPFLENLKQQKAEQEARTKEEAERRLPEIIAALARQAEEEKMKQLKIAKFKESLVLKMTHELAELLPQGEYYVTYEAGQFEGGKKYIGHARCKWLIESGYYGGVRGSFDIFGQEEDGTVTVGEILLTAEEAEDTTSVDKALEFNYMNPKREDFSYGRDSVNEGF